MINGMAFNPGWITDRLIMIFDDKEPISIDILNPFSGETQTLNPGLNDVYVFRIELQESLNWYIWKLVYDPTLSRLVYLREGRDQNEKKMVMIDLNTKQTIWEFEAPGNADINMPVWSPNGEKLLFVSTTGLGHPFQLLIIDKSGTEVPWINIQKDPGVKDEWHWSPDSQHIAFFSDNSLYELDLKTHQLIDFCLPYQTGFDEVTDGLIQKVFWSPDSSQILYQRYDAPALVIDLASEVAVPIVDSSAYQPIGWIRGE